MKPRLLSHVILFVQLYISIWAQESCSSKCVCKANIQKDSGNFVKITCGETEKITHLDELELLNIANELVQLNLSNNNLQTFSPKVELIALQKLNLSGNQITQLEEHQFKEVPKLKRLDLSANRIKHVDVKAFLNLKDLEKLKLNNNEISTITLGTLDAMPNLRQLDISNNPLQCDCGLLWILDYASKHSIKLMSNPKCSSSTFKGIPLRKLKVGVDIHCRSASHNSLLPFLDLQPANNQVVFEGDALKLHCKAPSITDSTNDSRLDWLWLDSNPKDHFSDISIINDFLPNAGIIDSVLYLKKLSRSHTGLWSCLFSSTQGNHSKSTAILVISDDTKYCPMTTTKGNKGTYIWPRTIVNCTVSIPCKFLNDYYDSSYQTVSHYCSSNGTWQRLNSSRCSYISDTTRILEGFSKVHNSILESARHLKEYTTNISIFKDVMDLVYTVKTIESYASSQPSEPLSNILMDVVNNLINLPWYYLKKSDAEHKSCSKLVDFIESLALANPNVLFQRESFIVQAFPLDKGSFSGLKCSWFRSEVNPFDSIFSCNSNNNIPDSTAFQGRNIETSIIIPDSIFNQTKSQADADAKDSSVVVSIHSSSNFFPIDATREGNELVSSAVIGVKIVGSYQIEPSHPVIVTIRAPHSTSYEVAPFTPVYWDQAAGNWSADECQFGHHWQDYMVFSCRKLGYYGLMQEVAYSNSTETYPGVFRLSHPAIYVGNALLFVSLLTAILSYILGFVSIQMPKKAKHCLINTWAAIALLCFIYSFGIYQTQDQKLCQIIGLILHYLSLSSLLWMCAAVNTMHKRLSKNGESILQDDDLPSEQPIKKPVMGLYLVGWGVALIVCGLSAAINVREYASHSHCFLRTGPALSALYLPFMILCIFLIVFFLLIRCAISNLDLSHGGHLSEGTQATEHVDLDLLEPNFPQQDNRSLRSYSSKTASSETEDNERSPLAQLKAHVIFVFLYMCTWLSGAFATVPPMGLVAYEAELFSGAFVICATTLSAFTLFFYCVARNDVRTQWMSMFRWVRRKRLIRSRIVSDTPPRVQIQSLPLPPISNSDAQAMSRSSSRSSARTKSHSHKAEVAAEGSISDRPSLVGIGSKINNIVLHRAQYRANVVPHIIENPTSAAEVFYNPHQSTVARKFFRRQRRNMMKRNNLQPKPPRDVNSDATSVFSEPRLPKNKNTEQNMFGTNSKVNNTNIHVEHIRKFQRKNPNIFSDSADEFECLSDVPVEKIVINAERLRKKEMSRNKTRKKSNVPQENISPAQMRTVSQQCTLDYSSENPLSDSILDKGDLTSPLSPTRALPSSMKHVRNVLHEDIQHSDVTGATVSFNVRRPNSPMEESHQYVEIGELRSSESTIRGGRFGIGDKNSPLARLRSPSNFSRASSASATDIDELYQQIRRGPLPGRMRPGQHFSVEFSRPQRAYSSPFLSDSEVTGCTDDRHRPQSKYQEDVSSIDIETTV
ncbi:adhesion G protein-coupled receptor A3 isoform X2 [Dendroctonus ponderosae]|uniref:adhesion G protein-coupled receptor A3 isoform X2 n=1 Tax=Dendroctonus ponderosae TaxID=77166 RepID=UPI00203612A0|nr:adhesion G protein-coupled receptor A3 isoform X2 [Dendroctonus ponderosae]